MEIHSSTQIQYKASSASGFTLSVCLCVFLWLLNANFGFEFRFTFNFWYFAICIQKKLMQIPGTVYAFALCKVCVLSKGAHSADFTYPEIFFGKRARKRE